MMASPAGLDYAAALALAPKGCNSDLLNECLTAAEDGMMAAVTKHKSQTP